MKSFETFGNITEDMVVTTLTDYLVQIGIEPDEDGDFPEELYERPDLILVGKIIACEVAIFQMRRTAYLCGSTIDIMRDIRRDFVNQHKELTGEYYRYFNEDIDW